MVAGFSRGCAVVVMALCWLVWRRAAHHGGDVEWADKAVGPVTGTATKFAVQFPQVFFEMDLAESGVTAVWTIPTRWAQALLRDHWWRPESMKPAGKVPGTL